jgi:hypothetical protein
MIAPLRLAVAVALVAGGPLVVGCNGSDGGSPEEGCTVSCRIPYGFATFNLSCSATDLTNVAVSGPCTAVADTPSNLVFEQSIPIYSPSPGVCHVELTFATGFTYSTDVTFTSQSANPSACCPLLTAPTQTSFTVNNPSTTCVDAGASVAPTDAPSDTAAQAEVDAPTDAPSDAAVDAQADAGADQ